ncbi:hypothetical protein K474DRAFT_1582461, partial [Panus rudis PR-1116 ss-1]
MFIGHEWLKYHNPNIDWRTGSLSFDRCPDECGYVDPLEDPDAEEREDDQDPEAKLQDGERLFAMDWERYMDKGRQWHLRAHGTKSTELAASHYQQQEKKKFEDIVP